MRFFPCCNTGITVIQSIKSRFQKKHYEDVPEREMPASSVPSLLSFFLTILPPSLSVYFSFLLTSWLFSQKVDSCFSVHDSNFTISDCVVLGIPPAQVQLQRMPFERGMFKKTLIEQSKNNITVAEYRMPFFSFRFAFQLIFNSDLWSQ